MKDNKTLYIYQASAGTGKTFTLAAYYISLLLRGENYRSIMAVTFTNKATAEMKDRIMNHLYWIAQGIEREGFLAKIADFLADYGLPMPKGDTLRIKADHVFREMLVDYDGVKVTTIDTFLQTLMSGLAHTLGNSAGYAVDLDSDRAISDAITQLLSTHLTLHEGLKDILLEYISDRMQEEGGWDIRASLTRLAKELFKETVQKSTSHEEINFDRTDIQNFVKNVKWQNLPDISSLHTLVATIPDQNEKVSYAKAFNSWKKSLLQDPVDIEKAYVIGKNPQKYIDAQAPAFTTLVNAVEKARQAYITWHFTMTHLADMTLLGYLQEQIENNQSESNSILLAKTANILAEALRPGDADFILEKAGLRYNHILLDEFQDTSTQQWGCFLPLVHEILSNGGTAFVVGDTKQGIYRWRNGDWRIMKGLETNRLLSAYAHPQALVENYRCHEAIIDVVDKFGYGDRAKKKGGSVRVRIYPHSFATNALFPSHDQAREQILADMFSQIENLLSSGLAKAEDCMILTRGHSDSKRIMQAFRNLDADSYPHLKSAGITSSDSLLLESSPSVQVVMNALRYCVLRDGVGLHYVALVTGEEESQLAETLEEIDPRMPMNALMEKIISTCLCRNGVFEGTDLTYLNSFRDKMADYIHSRGGAVAEFIRFWDEKLHKDSIAISECKQVRIMTIHSSKGLESKQLFIPFCTWKQVDEDGKKNLLWCDCAITPPTPFHPLKQVPIPFHKALGSSHYATQYIQEREAQIQDNDNLLYVALTRAAENLFVWADMEVSTDPAKQELKPDVLASVIADKLGIWEDVREAFNNYRTEPEGNECYAQYPKEWEFYISTDDKHNELPEPFSFKDVKDQEQVQSYAENLAIEFRMSQDSEKADFGTLCHDILAEMETRDDEQSAIRRAVDAGLVTTEEAERIRELIDRAWDNPQMQDWFSGNYQLIREEAMLTIEQEPKVYRPDRVMISEKTAMVLDYKFGAWNDHYPYQVRRYMRMMRDLGYSPVTGYLWMAEDAQLIEVK